MYDRKRRRVYMERGLYIATTGLLHNQRRLDVISNNMANVNTTGYKKDAVVAESFPDLLLQRVNDTSFNFRQAPQAPTTVNFLKAETENSYNVDIDAAFLRVETPFGVSHNKNLQFTVDNDGYLKTFYRMDGAVKTNNENYVLGKNGRVQVPGGPGATIEVDGQGNLLADGAIIDNLIFTPATNVIGTINSGVREDKVVTNFTQGTMIDTGNKLDLALKGDGFIKVHTDKGDYYTRDGSFSLSKTGELVTREGGYPVGKVGSIAANTEQVSINEYGEIIADGKIVDKIEIVDITNKEDLRKIGNNFYKIVDGQTAQETPFKGSLMQGYLEGANVNPVQEMVDMISVMRSYETSQKVVKAFDEMLAKSVNEIPKL